MSKMLAGNGSRRAGKLWSLGIDDDDDSDCSDSGNETDAARNSDATITTLAASSSMPDLEKKFLSLKRKREEIYQSSTGKRVKALQRQALKAVSDEIQHSVDREVVEETGVRLPILPHQKLSKSKRSDSECKGLSSEDMQRLKELSKHMRQSEHLAGLSVAEQGGGGDGHSSLEKELEASLQSGDLKTADELSNRIASRQQSIRIANAASHRNAEEEKHKRNEERERKHKKRLRWGFESKQRWERKGNM